VSGSIAQVNLRQWLITNRSFEGGSGKLQIERVPTKPGALLAESLVMLRPTAEAAEVEIVVDGAPSDWPVLVCDPVKLKQVFVNLLDNVRRDNQGERRASIKLRIGRSVCDGGRA
jgi:signal transduction histidine kinase